MLFDGGTVTCTGTKRRIQVEDQLRDFEAKPLPFIIISIPY